MLKVEPALWLSSTIQTRIHGADDIDQGRLVDLGQQFSRLHPMGEGGQTAVFLVGLASVFVAGAERGVTEYENIEMLVHTGGVEPGALQQFVLGIHAHPAVERGVQFAAVRVLRAAEALFGLFQDGIRRHQPDHGLGLVAHIHGQGIKDGFDGIGGDEGLAATGGHLDAQMRHPADGVAVGFRAGDTALQPISGKGFLQIAQPFHLAQEIRQIIEHLLLIGEQLHAAPSEAENIPGNFFEQDLAPVHEGLAQQAGVGIDEVSLALAVQSCQKFEIQHRRPVRLIIEIVTGAVLFSEPVRVLAVLRPPAAVRSVLHSRGSWPDQGPG